MITRRAAWILGLLALIVMSVGVAPSASAYTYGKHPTPDFTGYCIHHGYPKGATSNPSNAYAWACIANDGSLHGVNVGDVCRWSNPGQPNIVETLREYYFYTPSQAWWCQQLQSPQETGHGLNLVSFCQQYMREAGVQLRGDQLQQPVRPTARSWYCYKGTSSNPTYDQYPIDMYQACQWQYGRSYLDRTPNFYNPYSPACWL